MRRLLLLLTFTLRRSLAHHGSATPRPAGPCIEHAPRVTGAAHGAIHGVPSGSARGGARVVYREPCDRDAVPRRHHRDEAIIRHAPPDEILRRSTLPAAGRAPPRCCPIDVVLSPRRLPACGDRYRRRSPQP